MSCSRPSRTRPRSPVCASRDSRVRLGTRTRGRMGLWGCGIAKDTRFTRETCVHSSRRLFDHSQNSTEFQQAAGVREACCVVSYLAWLEVAPLSLSLPRPLSRPDSDDRGGCPFRSQRTSKEVRSTHRWACKGSTSRVKPNKQRTFNGLGRARARVRSLRDRGLGRAGAAASVLRGRHRVPRCVLPHHLERGPQRRRHPLRARARRVRHYKERSGLPLRSAAPARWDFSFETRERRESTSRGPDNVLDRSSAGLACGSSKRLSFLQIGPETAEIYMF